MARKIEKKLRNAIASLSTGVYYDEISGWYNRLSTLLGEYGFIPSDECPTVYNDGGHATMGIADPQTGEEVGYIWWSWYRMPSFRWEVICYVS